MELLHVELTDKIIKAFFNVYKELGFGFLEKVYENAMLLELRGMDCNPFRQQQIRVYFKNFEVGEYFADLVVDDLVIIEVKAAEGIAEEHEHQLINYLKATDKEVGLLLNFGKKPEFKRKIFTNERKKLR